MGINYSISCFILLSIDGIFIGATQTKEMRNAMMISVVSFIIVSIYLSKYLGNHGLWFSLLFFLCCLDQ